MNNTLEKARNQMTRRERFRSHTDAINYSLRLIRDHMNLLWENMFAYTAPKIYVTLTTPKEQRDVFAYHVNQLIPMVRVVVGRSSIFDGDDEKTRRVTILSSLDSSWKTHEDLIEQLLEAFSILIDAKTFVELPPRKHGQYCRWSFPLESQIIETIRLVVDKLGTK